MGNRDKSKPAAQPRKGSETAGPEQKKKKEQQQEQVLRQSHLHEMVIIRKPKEND
jgi:hypothetical protein